MLHIKSRTRNNDPLFLPLLQVSLKKITEIFYLLKKKVLIRMATQLHRCTFIRGLNWYTYLDLESRLLEISKYITFDQQNQNTWSETLAALLLLFGSSIDTFFRNMESCPCVKNEPSFKRVSQRVNRRRNKNWTIHDFRNAYEPIYEFSKNDIQVPFGLSSYPDPQHPFIQPFIEFQNPNGIPDWWGTYNGVKHEYYDHLQEATLDRVINSLGGLLLLHGLHKCSQEYLIRIGKIRDPTTALQVDELIDAFKDEFVGYPTRWTMLRDCGFQTKIFVFQFRPAP